jgi:hypothetical protein
VSSPPTASNSSDERRWFVEEVQPLESALRGWRMSDQVEWSIAGQNLMGRAHPEFKPSFFCTQATEIQPCANAGLSRRSGWETATTVTLRQPGGIEGTLPRANIATMKTTRQSLVREGLEGGLRNQDVADLVEFVFNPGN